MSEMLYPLSTGALSNAHKQLTPEPHDAFRDVQPKVFANGALTTKTKQLIAVAVAHVTQCPYCIRGHTKAAMREGATREIDGGDIGRSRMRAGAASRTRRWPWTKWKRLRRRWPLMTLSPPTDNSS